MNTFLSHRIGTLRRISSNESSISADPEVRVRRRDERGSAVELMMNHQMLKEVGHGRHGRVFQAICRRTSRIVAVKRVPPDLLDQGGLRAKCLDLAKRLDVIDHPNLLNSSVLETATGTLVIEMDWTDGLTLMDILKRRESLSLDLDAPLFWQLAEAFDAVNAARIPYNDELHKILIVTTEGAAPSRDSRERLYHSPAGEWPDFLVVINPWNFSQVLQIGNLPTPPLSFCRLLYCLLGGSPAKLPTGTLDYTPIATLTESGNQCFRRLLLERLPLGATTSICKDLLGELMFAEGFSLQRPDGPPARVRRDITFGVISSEDGMAEAMSQNHVSSSPDLLGLLGDRDLSQTCPDHEGRGNHPVPPSLPPANNGIKAETPVEETSAPVARGAKPPSSVAETSTERATARVSKVPQRKAQPRVISAAPPLQAGRPRRGNKPGGSNPPPDSTKTVAILVAVVVLGLLAAIITKIVWL